MGKAIKLKPGQEVEVDGVRYLMCGITRKRKIDLDEAVFQRWEQRMGWSTQSEASSRRLRELRRALSEFGSVIARAGHSKASKACTCGGERDA